MDLHFRIPAQTVTISLHDFWSANCTNTSLTRKSLFLVERQMYKTAFNKWAEGRGEERNRAAA